MTSYTNKLLDLGYQYSLERVKIKNEGNGYAYLTCIIIDKKKPYCIL